MKLVEQPYFPYRGGKARLRRSIVRWFPVSGTTYCEPFAGRANVFFLVRCFGKFQSWRLNDLQTFPFLKAIKHYDGKELPELDQVESKQLQAGSRLQLLLEPIIYWAGGLASQNESVTGSRGHKMDDYRRRLTRASQLLKVARLTRRDAIEVIEEYVDDPQALLYIDPPYLQASLKAYTPDMVDRKEMIRLLKLAKCRWVLSEYEERDLLRAFGEPMTRIYGVPINPIPGGKVRRAVECLWSNYPMEQPRKMNFGDSERPMKITRQILGKAGNLSQEEFDLLAPPHWHRKTKTAQYKRLCTHPQCYFDGERVSLLR